MCTANLETQTLSPPPNQHTTPIDVNKVRVEVEKYFPQNWTYIEACLAASATLYIHDIKDPASVILVGPASGGKGTTLDALKGHTIAYWSDHFTPASFVSQASNRTKEELKEIDLLPRIKDKVFIVPELAPIFNTRQDVLRKNMAVLTRVFDGEGYTVDAGTHGKRGYEEETRFTFLGATTPLHDSVWKTLGKLGNRLCFLNLEKRKTDTSSLARSLTQGISYKAKRENVRKVVSEFLDHLESNGTVYWNRSLDPFETVMKIAQFSELSGRLRGIIPTVYVNGRPEKGFPEIEASSRFTTLMYNLARGRALIQGRLNIDNSDLELVKNIALSSCYTGRNRLITFLIENGGETETVAVEVLLGCSKGTALDLMRTLQTLGVLDIFTKNLAKGGKTTCVRLRKEYQDLLLKRSS
jgi:hypothetical protein